jgi:hypothetical protein
MDKQQQLNEWDSIIERATSMPFGEVRVILQNSKIVLAEFTEKVKYDK